jgi:hypothetical protein
VDDVIKKKKKMSYMNRKHGEHKLKQTRSALKFSSAKFKHTFAVLGFELRASLLIDQVLFHLSNYANVFLCCIFS